MPSEERYFSDPFKIFMIIIVVLVGIGVLFSIMTGGIFVSMLVFPVLWGLFWLLLLIWFFSWLFRGPRWHRHHGMYASPKEIVRARYANGEITKKQYAEMMKELEKSE